MTGFEIETHELAFLGHVDLVGELLLQIVETAPDATLEDIGHGDQLDRPPLGIEGITDRACAAASTTDQRQPDRVIGSGVHVLRAGRRQHRRRSRSTCLLQKLAPRLRVLLSIRDGRSHDVFLPSSYGFDVGFR